MDTVKAHAVIEVCLGFISHWERQYRLNEVEIERLYSVFNDFEPRDQEEAMHEELQNILAARKLALKPPLTLEQTRRAEQNAIKLGWTALLPKD